jgi:hypothetical protein
MWCRYHPMQEANAARTPRLSWRGSGDRGSVGQKPERLLWLHPPSTTSARAGEDVQVCHSRRSANHWRE